MSDENTIERIITQARALGVSEVIIEGVTYKLAGPNPTPVPQPVPDVDPKELMKALPLDQEIDEDEVLYWSSPYYDQYMAEKEARAKRTKKDHEVD